MFPLSTFILLANLNSSLLPTAMPSWGSPKTKKHERCLTSIITKNYYSDIASEKSLIDDLIVPHEESIFENINNVFLKLRSFSQLEAEWDGPDSVVPSSSDIDKATNFVASIPAILPLPKAMLSRDGIVGLYWDDSVIYVDIQFEQDNSISIFSKDRSSGKERFVNSIDLANIDHDWYLDTLHDFLHPARDVLAA